MGTQLLRNNGFTWIKNYISRLLFVSVVVDTASVYFLVMCVALNVVLKNLFLNLNK